MNIPNFEQQSKFHEIYSVFIAPCLEQIKRMEEPDGKIVLREVKSLDTDGKVLFGLVLRKFVENHPQIICGHIASLYDLP